MATEIDEQQLMRLRLELRQLEQRRELIAAEIKRLEASKQQTTKE